MKNYSDFSDEELTASLKNGVPMLFPDFLKDTTCCCLSMLFACLAIRRNHGTWYKICSPAYGTSNHR